MASIRLNNLIFAALFLVTGIAQIRAEPSDSTHPDVIVSKPLSEETYERNKRDQVFVVLGSVHHAGHFPLEEGKTVTLAEALKRASVMDFSDKYPADLHNVFVTCLRNGVIRRFHLDARHGSNESNFRIMCGDEIYVPTINR